ncbi:unnamed protein product [Adineta ricciae]|uniref:CCHC-type domain-containing protein n=1 Tax=Adineta ricciae TaxID=249248 RepID=A0A816EDZ5_ADIRI|nr:unnamed protein product [Adineta ricciae]CAF1651480.1 unnamed protein product [Adineta ricciae]
MLAAELRRAQQRAAAQALERDQRLAARSQSLPISPAINPNLSSSNPSSSLVGMETQQYSKIIESVPIFSGSPRENVTDWLALVNLKFDMIGYTALQKRRFIPQYLHGDALRWHLANRDQLDEWDAYSIALVEAFPHIETTSRDMNLKLLRDRKQGSTESFTDYYASILDLCRKHNADMTDLQILDWIKAGMSLNLYERIQGEEFVHPHALLRRAQRLELDNAVLDARKKESTTTSPSKKSFSPHRSSTWSPYSLPSPPPFTSSYLPPLMSPNPASTSYSPSAFPSPAANSTFSSPNFDSDLSARPRRPIICFSCHQPGHISTQCPVKPVICYTCHQPGHIAPHCPSRPNV